MAPDFTHPTAAPLRGQRRIAGGGRQRAFANARRHSRLVRALKVCLPILAVVSTGALFLSPAMVLRMFYPSLSGTVGGVEVTTDQLRMINPRFDGFTADKGHYVVTAKAAVQMLDNTDLLRLETVHGHLVQVDQSWTDLTSKAGTYQTKTKALTLTDGIVITTSGDARMDLDHANVDVDNKIVTSDASVMMTMPNGTLNGQGLLVDNASRRLLLRDAVKAHLLPPKHAVTAAAVAAPAAPVTATSLAVTPVMSDAPIDITSRQLEVLDNAKTATFNGAVKAIQAGMTLHSDKMEVGYASPQSGAANAGPTAQNLSYVYATSNVVITTPDGRGATSDSSRFDQKANTMTLLGSVVLTQKTSQLHADSVIYDMVNKKTHVTASNRVTGHFEPDAAEAGGQKPGSVAASPGLGGLAGTRGATDISADTLEIANADNEAVFQGTVIVNQGGNRLTGDRLAVDMTRRHMAMTGPGRVTGVFEGNDTPAAAAGTKAPKVASTGSGGSGASLGREFSALSNSNGATTNIEADSLVVEDDRGLATFQGKVNVVRGGNHITAEQMVIEYAGGGATARDGTQLRRIRAKDHVAVRTADNELATSDWLLYDPPHNQLTMGGNVTVSQGDNVVHGEKLLVDLTTGESHFETGSNGGPAGATLPGAVTSTLPSGRIQVLITPQGIRQVGGSAPATAHPAVKPKQDMSASDVMVAPQ